MYLGLTVGGTCPTDGALLVGDGLSTVRFNISVHYTLTSLEAIQQMFGGKIIGFEHNTTSTTLITQSDDSRERTNTVV